MRIAVFDIGTNTIHMLIAEIHVDGSHLIIDHEKDTTRLGDGSFKDHFLDKARKARAFKAIKKFHKIAKKYQAVQMIGVATSAVREAQNGPEFIFDIFKKTKVKVRIISGEEEGRLVFLASHSRRDIQKGNVLTIDIGGGSMELVLGNKKQILVNNCFPLGVARLTDLYFKKDPPTPGEIRRLERHILEEIKPAIRKIRKHGFLRVIGTAGTMVNLAYAVYFDSEKRPLDCANHYEMYLEDVESVYKKISVLSLKKRLQFPELDKKRADIMIAGCVMVKTLMKALKIRSLTVSTQGIREGMILDFIHKIKTHQKVW